MRIDKKQKKKEIVLKIIVTFGLVKILIEVTTMSNKTKRYFLPEEEIPHYWYNIQADMVNKPMPPLHPGTKQPLKAEDLYPIFAQELCKQELNQTDKWIEIPEEVREMYKYYRSTPLVRAYGLEKALGTPAHIYFKNESVSPMGSHKHRASGPPQNIELPQLGPPGLLPRSLQLHPEVDAARGKEHQLIRSPDVRCPGALPRLAPEARHPAAQIHNETPLRSHSESPKASTSRRSRFSR